MLFAALWHSLSNRDAPSTPSHHHRPPSSSLPQLPATVVWPARARILSSPGRRWIHRSPLEPKASSIPSGLEGNGQGVCFGLRERMKKGAVFVEGIERRGWRTICKQFKVVWWGENKNRCIHQWARRQLHIIWGLSQLRIPVLLRGVQPAAVQ